MSFCVLEFFVVSSLPTWPLITIEHPPCSQETSFCVYSKQWSHNQPNRLMRDAKPATDDERLLFDKGNGVLSVPLASPKKGAKKRTALEATRRAASAPTCSRWEVPAAGVAQ
jgi:hypothetical protein